MAVADPPDGRKQNRPRRGWRRFTPARLSARRWWRESAFFGYLLNSPALLLLVLLEAYPIVQAVWTSFQHHNLMRPRFRGFAGLENYATIIDKPEFWTALYVTLVFVALSVSLIVVLGVAIAVLANQPIRGQAVLRTLILLPWAIPPVVNGLMWQWIYNSRAGALNGLLVSLGLLDGYRSWLSEPTTALLLTVLAHVWNQLPLAVLIFLAGLQTIPGDLLSAAMVDRAGPWRRFRHIVLPWLIHPLIIVLILQTMIAFRVFELIFVLTGGGPGSSTTVIAWLTYQTAFQFLDFGEANAYAVVIAVMTMLLAVFYLRSLYTRGEIRT